jgi:uncharacterized membrane protein YsdA (DUF1294 family)/cold shock CspA family protein
MKLKGTLKEWNDVKGFGFISPCAGGADVFTHISAFQNRSKRPKPGDVVIYHPEKSKDGKLRAVSVSYNGEEIGKKTPQKSEWRLRAAMLLSLAFLMAILVFGCIRLIPWVIVVLYFAASIIALFMYWGDKSAARKGHWRTKESSLLLCGLIGGWPGALIAQQLFRHKSSKIEFQLSFWSTVAVNCAGLGWVLTSSGGQRLLSVISAISG